MNQHLLKLYNWIENKDQRQRILFLAGIIVGVWILWYLLVESFLQGQHVTVTKKIHDTQETLQNLRESIDKINPNNPNSESVSLQRQYDDLQTKLKNINQGVNDFSKQLIPAARMVAALKTVLTSQSGITLTSVQNKTAVPVSLNPITGKGEAGSLFQHDMVLEFNGNYFATLKYLQRLEKLPWYLYWDEIHYQVTTYPNANISLKLHTLSTEQGLLHV